MVNDFLCNVLSRIAKYLIHLFFLCPVDTSIPVVQPEAPTEQGNCDLVHTALNIVDENLVLAYGAQSSKTVVVTGFLHGSDSERVNGEFNYNR